MADQWFRVPRVGSGTDADPFRPKYSVLVESWAGNRLGGPNWIVRFYADPGTLATIASQPDATAMNPTAARAALNGSSAAHLSFPIPSNADLNRRFSIE